MRKPSNALCWEVLDIEEGGRILAEGANEDAAILADWSSTIADGIE